MLVSVCSFSLPSSHNYPLTHFQRCPPVDGNGGGSCRRNDSAHGGSADDAAGI